MTLEQAIEKKASTDGLFAIAYAILQLRDSQDALTAEVSRIGTNGAVGPAPGCLEFIGMQMEVIATALRDWPLHSDDE